MSYRTLASRVGAWPEYVLILLTVLALGWAALGSRGWGPAGPWRNRYKPLRLPVRLYIRGTDDGASVRTP